MPADLFFNSIKKMRSELIYLQNIIIYGINKYCKNDEKLGKRRKGEKKRGRDLIPLLLIFYPTLV